MLSVIKIKWSNPTTICNDTKRKEKKAITFAGQNFDS